VTPTKPSDKSILVQKYGGVCLATPEKIKRAAEHVRSLVDQGNRLVVVVSAMGPTTDELTKLAHEVSHHPNQRELDMLLTAGERISMSLMSMALTDLGLSSISFTGSQAGVMTDHSYSNARIMDVRPIRVEEELSKNKVVVLAGFQGVNPESKEITTLGRGGTDTTAVAMAAKLKAKRCEIIKEVSGVCSSDPKMIPEAQGIERLSYEALSDICFWGAKVLQYRCVELAQRTQVPVVIKRWEDFQIATEVVHQLRSDSMETSEVISINSHAEVDHLEIDCAHLNEGFNVFKTHLSQFKISYPQILASNFDNGKIRLMVTGDALTLQSLRKSLEEELKIRSLGETQSTVTVTCSGLYRSEKIFDLIHMLHENGVKAHKILSQALSVTFGVPQAHRETAIKVLHSLVGRKL
tara:strand:- start:424 stop:1650 length:1227 start_codon:yes stop_codon:yes gene_type:complete